MEAPSRLVLRIRAFHEVPQVGLYRLQEVLHELYYLGFDFFTVTSFPLQALPVTRESSFGALIFLSQLFGVDESLAVFIDAVVCQVLVKICLFFYSLLGSLIILGAESRQPLFV